MRILHYNQLGSTLVEARRLWAEGTEYQHGLVVVADEQTAGLGRDGHQWFSPLGGLWMTIAWPLNIPLDQARQMPLVVGLAVSEVLAQRSIDAQVKWPNDILVNGRKIAGILCQMQTATKPPALLLGIGINVNFPMERLDSTTLRIPATTMLHEIGHETPIGFLLADLIYKVRHALHHFEANGFSKFHDLLQKRMAWIDRRVTAQEPGSDRILDGIFQGVDADGAAILQTHESRIHLTAASLSLQQSTQSLV